VLAPWRAVAEGLTELDDRRALLGVFVENVLLLNWNIFCVLSAVIVWFEVFSFSRRFD
jgi:hypothetical protein